MKDKQTQMWIPLYVDKWIFGSTRIELEPAERSVFVDLLAFGAKDNGFIRANETTAYPHPQLAGLLAIPVELLQSTIVKCLHFDKLTEPTPGIYKLKNWAEYQFTRQYVHEVNTKGIPSLHNCKVDLTDCKAIRKDRIGEDKKEHTTTAKPEPAKAVVEGSKPVNWANCKSPIQRVIAKYVELGQPALYAHATQAEATGLFKEQGKAVGPILEQCGGNVDVAVRVVELAAAYYGKKGLDWSLYAVSKNCGDFLNTVKKEQNYGANR